MADLTGMMQAAAGSAGGDPIGYLAVARGASSPITNGITVLNRTDPASLSFGTTYDSLAAQVVSCDYSSDGNYLVAGQQALTASCLLFDTSSPDTLTLVATYNVVSANSGGMRFTKFSPDNNYILASGFTTFTLLDHTTPGSLSLATTYVTGQINFGGAFSPDGNYIALAGSSSVVTLLDHTTPGSVSLAATYSLYGEPRAVTFNHNGDYLAIGARWRLTLLNHTTPGTLSLATTYNAGTQYIYGLGYTPDGNYLAATFTTPLRLFNTSTPGSLSLVTTYTLSGTATQQSGTGTIFSPTGDYLAVALSSSNINLFDHTTPGTLALATTYVTGGAPCGLAFSPEVTT